MTERPMPPTVMPRSRRVTPAAPVVMPVRGKLDSETIVLRASHCHPDTSHAAMAAYDKETLQGAAALVVSLHQQYGPLADFELAVLFERHYDKPCCVNLYRQARSAARDQGQIRDSGVRKKNPTTNRLQVVWEHCDIPPLEIPTCPTCGALLRRQRRSKP